MPKLTGSARHFNGWPTSMVASIWSILLQNSSPPGTAAVVAIYASMSNDTLREDYAQHKPTLVTLKLEDFAKEFAVAF